MKRREFITLLSGAAAWSLAARAQQAMAKPVHIGVLTDEWSLPIESLREGLREWGYIEGKNLRFEYRMAEGQNERHLALAAELVALPVDVIVTWGTPAALAAKRATSTIPIVMGAIGDPVRVGVVSNLAHPGGNITGFDLRHERGDSRLVRAEEWISWYHSRVGAIVTDRTERHVKISFVAHLQRPQHDATLAFELEEKRLELLRELLSGRLTRVAVLTTTNPSFPLVLEYMQRAADAFGMCCSR
jgi:hypothetical protein